LPNVRLSHPGAAAGPARRAPAWKIWSVARFVPPLDGQNGDWPGRVAAGQEACEQRRGACPAGAEHEPENDCVGGDYGYAGGEARGGTEAVRRDVHGAKVGGVANRALTAC
jgi:hypothetical protein